MASITQHRNAHLDDNNMHEVKGFPSASNGYSYRKNMNGRSAWLRDFRLPNVISQGVGYTAAPTEVDGDIYAITSPELNIDGIVWQSATTVRFTFTSGYDSTLYSTGSYLQVTGSETDYAVHNGVWVITTVNASYLEITNASITDGTNDVPSSASSVGYVSHESFDPENLANGQSIPRQGLVYHDGDLDLWFGMAFETGDRFYNVDNNSFGFYNGTSIERQTEPITVEVPLTATQILNSTAVDAVDAQGADKVIVVTSYAVKYTHVTTAYDVGLRLNLFTDTASSAQWLSQAILGTASSSFSVSRQNNTATTHLVANKKLTVVADGTSTVGDGTAIAYITYYILKI